MRTFGELSYRRASRKVDYRRTLVALSRLKNADTHAEKYQDETYVDSIMVSRLKDDSRTQMSRPIIDSCWLESKKIDQRMVTVCT